MSIESNKTTFRRVVDELINGQDYDLIDELIAPDFVEHEEIPGIDSGIEGFRQAF